MAVGHICHILGDEPNTWAIFVTYEGEELDYASQIPI